MTVRRRRRPEPWLARGTRDPARGISARVSWSAVSKSNLHIRLIEAITNRGPRRVLPRSPGTGVYWANVPRDDDEGRAVVFVLDRDRLLTGYRLSLVNEGDYIDEQRARV
jgi:hypothetical protein